MKRNRILMLALLLCLSLAACGRETTVGVLTNKETGATLSLGMTSEEVETALEVTSEEKEAMEQSGETGLMWMAEYGQGAERVVVFYDCETDAAVQLVLENESRWMLDGAITLGAGQEEIVKQYGEPTFQNNKVIYRRNDDLTEYGTGLSYNYDEGGVQTDGSNTDMILTFNLNPENELDYVAVVKYDAKYDA